MHASQIQGCVVEQRVEKNRKIVESVWVHNVVTVRTDKVAGQCAMCNAKLAGVWARGASEKMWDPVRIFATVEVSNFKFGTRIGFGTSLPKKRRLGPKLAGAWAREASEKIWDPLFISATD